MKFDLKPTALNNGPWVTLDPTFTSSLSFFGQHTRAASGILEPTVRSVADDGQKPAAELRQPQRLRSTKPSARLRKLVSKEYRTAAAEANVANRVAVQVRLLREKAGLSQKQLAQRLDTQQSAIARLEDPDYGRHSISMLKRVAEYFDVAPWVEFVSYATFLRRTADLSRSAVLPSAYREEFDPDGNPLPSVQLVLDGSSICLTNYFAAISPSASFVLSIGVGSLNPIEQGGTHDN